MKFTCHLIYLLVFVFLFSCSPKFYAPQGQNVPLFSQKGDASIAGGFSSVPGETANGFHLQTAVAVSDEIGIMSSFYRVNSGLDENWDVVGKVFDIGAGYYSKINDRWRFETYGGIGFGSFLNDSRTDNQDYEAKFMKPFVQPSIGLTHKSFDVALTTRMALVNFTKYSGNAPADELQLADDFFDEKGSTFVIEPGLTARAGSETVKVQLQYVYSSFSYNSDEFSPVLQDYVSVGLIIELLGKTEASE